MAFSTLTLTLRDSSTATVTLKTSNAPDAQSTVQFINRGGGLWDDLGRWIPISAVEDDRWLSIEEAMQLLGFSKSYLYTRDSLLSGKRAALSGLVGLEFCSTSTKGGNQTMQELQPPLPKNLFWRGKTIWCRLYTNDGTKELRVSCKTDDPRKAEQYYKKRVKDVAVHEKTHEKLLVRRDFKRTIGELMDALKTNFELRGKASSQNLSGIQHVKKNFGHVRALSLTKEQIAEYVSARRKEGYRNATINRWLQAMHCAYKLAEIPAPKMIRLSEADNVRSGFFTDGEIRKVITHLPEYTRDFVLFGWLTGWRKNAIASLKWQELDGDSITLRAEHAKNRRAWRLPLEGELLEIIERRRQCRTVKDADGTVKMCQYIFHRDGLQVADFRDSWTTACKMAGVEGKLFHDLRRSSCKNMLAARVPQAVCMKISQHVTDSMFRRYAIVEESEMRDALASTQAHVKAQAEAQREKVLTVAV